jgi:hypothetical protein
MKRPFEERGENHCGNETNSHPEYKVSHLF